MTDKEMATKIRDDLVDILHDYEADAEAALGNHLWGYIRALESFWEMPKYTGE